MRQQNLSENLTTPIILYDGDCYLCDEFIQYVVRSDKGKHMISPQDSIIYGEIAALFKLENRKDESIYLFDKGRIFEKSAAIARIMACCGWKGLIVSYLITMFPNKVGDWGYDAIARNRRRIISRKSCSIPDAVFRSRII
jgi:predicted DCC family thiol-disulfide oxidoreductase YuxK